MTFDKEMERYRKRVVGKRSRRPHNGRRQADRVSCVSWHDVALWAMLGALGAILVGGCVQHIPGSM
jgi:hypothetical protein